MPDWTKSMKQSYEYYVVDPVSWNDIRRVDGVMSCGITRDSTVDTLGSATIDIAESVGECYIRAYLVTEQDGRTEKEPLATVLVQTPSSKFDGKIRSVSMDAYTPLIELKEGLPPLGYSRLKDEPIMDSVYTICKDNMRGPVVKPQNDKTLYSDFISQPNDTWLTFCRDLASNARFTIGLDEMGRVIFEPVIPLEQMQPKWTYTDGENSIMLPEIDMDHDIYGIPNVVEVVYSTANVNYVARAVNDDPNSPVSTVNRGREILHRVTDLSMIGNPTNYQIDEYAKTVLKQLSSVEYTVKYTHGYCPVRVGDCVRLNYEKAGIKNIKARVVSQSIKCEPGCPVTETAVFTEKLWG